MKTNASRSSTKPAIPARRETRVAPTHQQISARAEAIWQNRGRPQGADEEIWLEAELQLLREEPAKGTLSDARRPGFRSDSVMADLDDLYPGPEGRETTSL